MSKLEMIFLMKVSLHLPTFEDVINFLMVCKKAEDAIKSLKVNPFFRNTPSLQKFMKHFEVETIKSWDDLKKEDEEIAKKLLSKVTVLDLSYSFGNSNRNKVNNFFIKEAIQFTNLQKIEGAIELLIEFFEIYTQKGEMMYLNFPKRIEINTTENYAITFHQQFFDQMELLLSYIPNNGLTTIDVIVYKNPSENNKDLLKELLHPNQIRSYEDCLCCDNGKVLVDEHVNGDRFNDVLEKSYTTTCVIRKFSDGKTTPIWNVPECISKIEIYGNGYVGSFGLIKPKIFNSNVSMIQELSLKEVENVNFPFPFTNLVKIKVEKSSNCRFILNSQKLEYISLRDVHNCLFVNSIDSVKEIVISKLTNCVLPFISFKNRLIHIEDSNDLCFGKKKINVFKGSSYDNEKEDQEIVENIQSPLEFMGIELNDFNKLIIDCLIYPSEVNLKTLLTKSSIFKMRAFQPQTRRVKVDGNVIQRVIPQGEDGVDLVVSSKFYVKNDGLMVVNPKKPESLIPATIRYFEVTVQNYCYISIGLIDSTRYQFHENKQVGWDKYSIGYHSDDGALFIETGTNPIQKYGKAYGEKNGEKNVVGCGYNTITEEVFYTINGTKLQHIKVSYENMSAAIGLNNFDSVTINYGDNPFVFDHYSEMEILSKKLSQN
ncbi:B30.2/SPRY domain-containing protein [Entamoeba marina]